VTLADLHMIAVPCDGTFDDLAIHSVVASKLVAASPLFKVEQVAEELECVRLTHESQAERAAKMSFQQNRGLLKVRQHS